MKKYFLTPQARRDVFEIVDFIAAEKPTVALKIRDKLHEFFDRIAKMPAIGHVRTELLPEPCLFFSTNPWLIAYRPYKDHVVILAVVHADRELSAVFGRLLDD